MSSCEIFQVIFWTKIQKPYLKIIFFFQPETLLSISIEKSGNITEKEIDVAPFIVGGTTLIPLRGLLEEMGAEISWDGEKSEVTIKAQNKEIKLQIWNKRVYVKDNRYGNIMYTLLTYPVIKDSRTFIPLRFVSEQLGYNVEWIGETQTIKISAPEE